MRVADLTTSTLVQGPRGLGREGNLEGTDDDVPLQRLRSGQRGWIRAVSGRGELTNRLREMGLRAGSRWR